MPNTNDTNHSNVSNLRELKSREKHRRPRNIPANAVSVRVPEMCEMLGIGPTKANELIRSGAVDSVLLGKTRLVSVDSIRALISGKAA